MPNSTQTIQPQATSVRELRPSLASIIAASKKPENFWFRVYYGLAAFICWFAIRMRWTPNQLTITGAVLNLIAFIYLMASPVSNTTIVFTYALLNIAHLFDCADGQLAFVANMRSELGYWLDSSLDIFKSIYICLLLIKIIYTQIGYQTTPAVQCLALVAAAGNPVNYAMSVHAVRFRLRHDGYESTSFDVTLKSRGLKRWLTQLLVSHLREYGNVLLVLVLFATDRNVGLACTIVFGMAHWLFALRRVIVISGGLRTQ